MSESQAKQLLGRPFTADYEPSHLTGFGYYTSQSRRPAFSPRWVPEMLTCQRIQFALRMIKGPILSSSRFYIKDEDSDGENHSPLKKYLIKNITRFWRQSSTKALRAVEWGYSGSECLFQIEDDKIVFDSLKALHPNDIKVLTKDGKKVGISVQNTKGRAGRIYLGGPKSLWHIVSREESQWYGLSRLFGSFQPWLEFYSDGGAKDIRRLYYHKYAFSGEVGYYPVGNETGTTGDYTRSNKQLMRSLLEKRRSGAVVIFPNTFDAEGNRKWLIEPAQSGPGVIDILQYHKDLKQEIFEGMGIPQEVVEAAEVGSGWSGRMVPASAFFSSLQEFVNWLIFDFDQQVLRPLVRLNFGIKNPSYEIIPFGLLKGSGEDEENEKENPQSDNTQSVPPDRQDASRFSIAV